MKRIGVVTSTRADFGILIPLIEKIDMDSSIELILLVTGTHLSKFYGYTISEIHDRNIKIAAELPILIQGNTEIETDKTIANAIVEFGKYFIQDSLDLLVVLGDRTEILGVCIAAMNANIPIAHISGGEVTEGAVDDCIRHSITKMSYIHFASTEIYRRRIIQMGEEPERVFNVGALSTENILKEKLMQKEELCMSLGITMNSPLVTVTFHPVTMEPGEEVVQTQELIEAMNEKKEFFYLITKSNSDVGGIKVNEMLETFAKDNPNVKVVASLGMKKYLSAVKNSKFVLGNSSSGIVEAPTLGTPTVNIGNRQKGRLMAKSIISCEPQKEEIVLAMERAETMQHEPSFLYGDGRTSERMIKIIKKFLDAGTLNIKKKYYDIDF